MGRAKMQICKYVRLIWPEMTVVYLPVFVTKYLHAEAMCDIAYSDAWRAFTRRVA